MKIPTKFREYIWLVNTIYKAGKISFSDLRAKWLDTDMSQGVQLARSTFNRHMDAIQDIFGIYIDCDRRDGYRYFIGNEGVLAEDSVQNWILSTLSVSNTISEGLSLQGRILLESIPSENSNLEIILDAMKLKVRLQMEYQKYGHAESKQVIFEPYCIKLFKRRWYVLGHLPTDDDSPSAYRIYSFDRIKRLALTDEKFDVPTDFNAQHFFKDYYGAMISHDTQPERIIVRAFGNERYYLRDLPIHHSQREIFDCDEYAEFELFLHPTADFCSHVLSRSSQLQVTHPQWLAERICQMLRGALERYKG